MLSSLAGFKLLMDVFGVVPGTVSQGVELMTVVLSCRLQVTDGCVGVVPGTVSQGVELMCCPLLQASSY